MHIAFLPPESPSLCGAGSCSPRAPDLPVSMGHPRPCLPGRFADRELSHLLLVRRPQRLQVGFCVLLLICLCLDSPISRLRGTTGARMWLFAAIYSQAAGPPSLPVPAPPSGKGRQTVKWALAGRVLALHPWPNLAASRARGQEVAGPGPL